MNAKRYRIYAKGDIASTPLGPSPASAHQGSRGIRIRINAMIWTSVKMRISVKMDAALTQMGLIIVYVILDLFKAKTKRTA